MDLYICIVFFLYSLEGTSLFFFCIGTSRSDFSHNFVTRFRILILLLSEPLRQLELNNIENLVLVYTSSCALGPPKPHSQKDK